MRYELMIEEKPVPLVEVRDMTLDELTMAKDVSRGMSPIEIEARMWEGDPDVWKALITVSAQRAGLDLAHDAIGGISLLEAVNGVLEARAAELERQAQEAAEQSPPAEAADAAAEEARPATGSATED